MFSILYPSLKVNSLDIRKDMISSGSSEWFIILLIRLLISRSGAREICDPETMLKTPIADHKKALPGDPLIGSRLSASINNNCNGSKNPYWARSRSNSVLENISISSVPAVEKVAKASRAYMPNRFTLTIRNVRLK